MNRYPRSLGAIALAGLAAAYSPCSQAAEPRALLAKSQQRVPAPPWPAGDERGMANAIGPGTWQRCAWHMSNPKAKVYELSYVRSNTMPKSPFSAPLEMTYRPTASIPFSLHAYNGEHYSAGAEPQQQATQFDALGHFGWLKQPWDPKTPIPTDDVQYYGGYTQKDVKPTPASPLMKLGVEKSPPIITTAVLLDAKTLVGKGQPMKDGQTVTAADIEAMLKAQGLAKRGILPGDVVYVRTGWGDYWKDPDTEKFYYTKAPGLSYDAAQYLGKKRIVAIGLDTPFIDTVPEGMMQGKAAPAAGTPQGLPFAIHHYMITQMGIHHLENVKLDEAANDKLWTSCTMVLPPLERGNAGAMVRPVAIGVPNQ
jgi:kynurenine formamidase